jgi:hypothetical protein
MGAFKLLNDTEATIDVRLAHRKPIREAVGLDIVEAAHNPDKLSELLDALTDSDKLWQIVSVVSGISVDDLLANADGSTEEEAGTALLESLISFFPRSSPMRNPLNRLLEKAKEQHDQQLQTAEAMAMEVVEGLVIGSGISDAEASTSG